MNRRHYRKRTVAGSIISDTVSIGSKLPWWGALLFGMCTFLIFYFILPSWLELKLQSQSNNSFYPMLEIIFERRIHWIKWVGIACGLVGLYFGFRNYYFYNKTGYQERGIIAIMRRLLSRKLD